MKINNVSAKGGRKVGLLIYKFYKTKKEEAKKKEKRNKRIERNSKKFIEEIEEQQNIGSEIIWLKLFCSLLNLFYEINLEKELWEGLDDEYKQQHLKINYQKIINLFNETRGLIFYLLFYCVFVYNENIKLF